MHRMRHHRVVHHFDHVTMEAGLPEFLNRRLVNFGRWICPETGSYWPLVENLEREF